MAATKDILGLVLAICLFARRRRLDPWIFLHTAASTGPLGIAFGRIANLINGERWGRPSSLGGYLSRVH